MHDYHMHCHFCRHATGRKMVRYRARRMREEVVRMAAPARNR